MRHRCFVLRWPRSPAGVRSRSRRRARGVDAEKGKAAFMKYGCWQCHGTQGQGSAITSAGKVLAPDPLPL